MHVQQIYIYLFYITLSEKLRELFSQTKLADLCFIYDQYILLSLRPTAIGYCFATLIKKEFLEKYRMLHFTS